MRPAEPELALRHAAALGLLQGPTELLPVSSSGHTSLVPFLAGWPYGELDPELRKSFELSLHAGTGVALLLTEGRAMLSEARRLDRRGWTLLGLSLAPPAAAGLALRGPVERRLGRPLSTAAGLLGGAMAMAIADARPRGVERGCEDAAGPDGLALGLAQSLALLPGVSRSGASLAAARARGFSRRAAHGLSWRLGAPLILGASLPELARLGASGRRDGRTALAIGAAAAFASTVACSMLLRPRSPRELPLLPFAVYRAALAMVAVDRVRRSQ